MVWDPDLGTGRRRRRDADAGTDLTDAQWAMLAPFVPPRAIPARGLDDRLLVSGMLHKVKNRIFWKEIPERYGRYKSIQDRFVVFRQEKVFERALWSAEAEGQTDVGWLIQLVAAAQARRVRRDE